MSIASTACLSFLLLGASATDLYVSAATGHDSNDGTLSRPLQSLQKAVAVLTAKPRVAHGRVTVHVEGGPHGIYSLTAVSGGPLQLEAGAADNVSFVGEGSSLPLLTGAIPVSQWATDVRDGVDVLVAKISASALPDVNLVDTIFVHQNLPARHAELRSRRQRPRTEVMQWDRSLSMASTQMSEPTRGQDPEYGDTTCGESCRGFVFREGQINETWSLEPDSLAQWKVAAFQSWTKAYHTVAYVDRAKRMLVFNEEARYPYGKFPYCALQRYYIEGIPELRLEPGEFKLVPTREGDAFLLSYRPVDDTEKVALQQNILKVFVPSAETIVQVNARGVQFRSLAFMHGRGVCGNSSAASACDSAMVDVGSMVEVRSGSDVGFYGCTFGHSENHAVNAVWASNFSVRESLFAGIGATAISLTQARSAIVEDNSIIAFGARHPSGSGIVVSNSPDCLIRNNDMSLGFANGIKVVARPLLHNGPPMKIYRNHVHSNGYGLPSANPAGDLGICDFAGIHIDSNGMTQPATSLFGNVFRNITAFANGGEGIYLDCSSTSNALLQNLVFDVISSPLLWNMNPQDALDGYPPALGAASTNITNNVFVQNRTSEYYSSQTRPAIIWKSYSKANFHHNVIAVFKPMNGGAASSVWYQGATCMQRAENVTQWCTNIFEDNFRTSYMGSNMYFNGTGSRASDSFPGKLIPSRPQVNAMTEGDASFEEWSSRRGRDSSSVVNRDPGFADAHAGNFAVTSMAAAALQIQPLTDWVKKAGASWTPTLTQATYVEETLLV